MGSVLLLLLWLIPTVMSMSKWNIRSIHCYPSLSSFGIQWKDISNNRLDAPGISVIYTLIARQWTCCRFVGIDITAVVDRMTLQIINEYNQSDYNILALKVQSPINITNVISSNIQINNEYKIKTYIPLPDETTNRILQISINLQPNLMQSSSRFYILNYNSPTQMNIRTTSNTIYRQTTINNESKINMFDNNYYTFNEQFKTESHIIAPCERITISFPILSSINGTQTTTTAHISNVVTTPIRELNNYVLIQKQNMKFELSLCKYYTMQKLNDTKSQVISKPSDPIKQTTYRQCAVYSSLIIYLYKSHDQTISYEHILSHHCMHKEIHPEENNGTKDALHIFSVLRLLLFYICLSHCKLIFNHLYLLIFNIIMMLELMHLYLYLYSECYGIYFRAFKTITTANDNHNNKCKCNYKFKLINHIIKINQIKLVMTVTSSSVNSHKCIDQNSRSCTFITPMFYKFKLIMYLMLSLTNNLQYYGYNSNTLHIYTHSEISSSDNSSELILNKTESVLTLKAKYHQYNKLNHNTNFISSYNHSNPPNNLSHDAT